MNNNQNLTGLLQLKVLPNASRNKITTLPNGTLKVSVTAHPEKGKANEAVIKIIAQKLGIKQRDIEIVQGAHSSQKTIKIARNS